MNTWQQIESSISQHLSKPFSIKSKSSVGGGCINSAFRISSDDQAFCVKLNGAELLEMFLGQLDGNTAVLHVDMDCTAGTLAHPSARVV